MRQVPSNATDARAAPWPLLRQIQGACDAPKFLAARLAGVDPPKHEDNERTLEELRARIGSVTEYLDTFEASGFADAAERKITLGFFEGKSMRGEDYMMEFALPSFYFHLAMVYAILRHNGVELGKRDFISSLRLND